ncbi:hypothetical protein BDV96DRAFT_661507, partial [Lophiotrema nucula]
LTHIVQCSFIVGSLALWPLTTVKLSVLLFYKRIFQVSRIRVAIWIGILIVSCWGIVFFLLVLLQMDPISSIWGAHPGRLRYDVAKVGPAVAGSSIGLDLAVLSFPIPLILRLHMSTKQKLGVVLMFLFGSFAVVAATARLVLLIKSMQQIVQTIEGFTRTGVRIQSLNAIFVILEPNCSIIAACFPCYGPLFRRSRQQPFALVYSTPRKSSRSYVKVDDTRGERDPQIELGYRSES